jgi:hypothetical protein
MQHDALVPVRALATAPQRPDDYGCTYATSGRQATQHRLPCGSPIRLTARAPIWRRIQIEGFASLRRLHHTLQAAFGWTDSHLHEFEIDDKTYAMFDLDDVLESMDPDNTFDDRKAKLEKAADPGAKFVYKYDFGDGWEHDIVVEKVHQAFLSPRPSEARFAWRSTHLSLMPAPAARNRRWPKFGR